MVMSDYRKASLESLDFNSPTIVATKITAPYSMITKIAFILRGSYFCDMYTYNVAEPNSNQKGYLKEV